MKNIIIFISGEGSNMRALVNASQAHQWANHCDAQIACVISNKASATGLQFAQKHHIPTHVVDHKKFENREAFDQALLEICQHYDDPNNPALVVLAGFMRVLTPLFVDHFHGRLINIHPSLLPAFQGLNTHQRAIDAGCKFAGASIHWVTSELDAGKILDQAIVPILAGDTAQTLAARVLTQEHLLYPRVVEALLKSKAQP